jgi:hypothetical protein
VFGILDPGIKLHVEVHAIIAGARVRSRSQEIHEGILVHVG